MTRGYAAGFIKLLEEGHQEGQRSRRHVKRGKRTRKLGTARDKNIHRGGGDEDFWFWKKGP